MRHRVFLATCLAVAVSAAVTLAFASDVSRVARSWSHRDYASGATRVPQETADSPGGYCRTPLRSDAASAQGAGHPATDAGPDSTVLLLLQGRSSVVTGDSVCAGVPAGPREARTIAP